jgi:hypothetical protein
MMCRRTGKDRREMRESFSCVGLEPEGLAIVQE